MDLPSSRHLTRKCKVLIQILADVFAFILSYAVSIVFSRFNASGYAAYSAVVCIVTLIMLYLLRYYSVKIELSSIEFSQRCLKGVGAVYIASAVISLIAGQSDFAVFSFLYLTYFFIFSLGARFIFKVMLQNRRVGKALKKGYPKAVVYGAGDIGTMLARQYFNGKLEYELVGYVDDDPSLRKTDVRDLNAPHSAYSCNFSLKT